MMSEERDERVAQEWYDRKTTLMEAILGKEHNIVSHAIIPYAIGGGLDLYYYPNGVPGTAIATKELCESPKKGSSNDVFALYELVMFTKHPATLDSEVMPDDSTPFGQARWNINAILSHVAPYSAQASLNPNETCEFPAEMEKVGGKCLIFDTYGEHEPPKRRLGLLGKRKTPFGLLLVIEVFRSEMEFARHNGGESLLRRLKKSGHYPYSELERKPVA